MPACRQAKSRQEYSAAILEALTQRREVMHTLRMIRPGIDLAALRKAQDLSQAQLAERIGVSQATVSRLEKGEYVPTLKIAVKVGRALGIELKDLVTEEAMRIDREFDDSRRFFAFCPNPFCERNVRQKKDGRALVYWKSGTYHDLSDREDINFCVHCGTDLVKECPGCGRLLENDGTRFCIRCGTRITDRPTSEEWTRISAELDDDDIPF